ncbi:MAG: FecR domain-containing protein [Mediterranea sp.]|jgi:ferric-dicitrate binding protein FerR (iron transport regulator)|nr:FecR domain-containing protein [Mediterranea sp.]
MIKRNTFQALVLRLLIGKSTTKETQEFLRQDAVQRLTCLQWEQGDQSEADTAVGRRIYLRIEERLKERHRPTRLRLNGWRGFAAAAVTGLTIGLCCYLTWHHVVAPERFVEVSAVQEMRYVLPDSSVVWMKAGSRLRFAEHFVDNRRVELTGSSLFDVKKQTAHPFRVQIGRACIEVKGTVFQVQRTPSSLYNIALLRGKIEFTTGETGNRIELRPAQSIAYNPTSNVATIHNLPNVGWKEGRFSFDDIPLSTLVSTINQFFNIDIRLGKHINPKIRFTGGIRVDETLDDIVTKLCFTLNLKKESIDETTVVLQ